MGKRICPLCGREVSVVINGVCPQCYAERYGIVDIPSVVFFDVCKYCGSIRLGNRWVQVSSFEDAVEAAIKHIISRKRKNIIFNNINIKIINYKTLPNWRTEVDIVITGEYDGELAQQSKRLTVRLNPTICPVCKTRISGEYDTLLQIRGTIPRNLQEIVLREVDRLGLHRQIVDLIEVKEGVDVYFTHTGAARKIAKRLARLFKGRIEGLEYEDVTISSTGQHRARKTLRLKLDATNY